VFPLKSRGTVDRRQGTGRKRDANAFRRLRSRFKACAEEGQHGIRFEREVEDQFAIRKSVVEVKVEIGFVSFEISKDEHIGGLEGFERRLETNSIGTILDPFASSEIAKAVFEFCRVGR